MTKYMEYTKGGDILIAPSLSYKHQYVLKCDLCEDFFGDLGNFLSHYLSHYEMISSDEEDKLSQHASLDEQQIYEVIDNSDDDSANGEYVKKNEIEPKKIISKRQRIDENEESIITLEEDSNDNHSNENHENINFKNGATSFDDTDMHKALMEIDNGTLRSVEGDYKADDDQLNAVDLSENVVTKNKNFAEDKSNLEFFQKLMSCKEDVTELISAYKNEPHLWDFNHHIDNRKNENRIASWSKIAKHMQEKRNLTMNSDQVAASIFYLRQRFRERKQLGHFTGKLGSENFPLWAFRKLQFLAQFVEANPIGLLDIHQDLATKQTQHVLNIFQRCSTLWDTNKIEFYCTNTRDAAVLKMKNIMAEEIGLEVNEDAIKNYVDSIRQYFSSAKRQKGEEKPGSKHKMKYYDQLLFLTDHVGPFKCPYCNHTILSPLTRKSHLSQHTGDMPFECPECKKQFKNVENFVFHMRRHLGDLNHECKLCGKRFLRAVELRDHMRCHTGDKPYCCETCGASFTHRTGFARHKKVHTKKYVKFCPYCSKGFYTKDSMMKHIVVHRNDRNFMCSICGKSFKTKTTLKSHVATHENGNYECDICGKSFKNKINLWQHKRKHRLKAQIKADNTATLDEKIYIEALN